MTDPTKYAMLITSLPYLKPVFPDKSLPISKIQLEKRLALLSDEDSKALDLIQKIVHWDYMPLERKDTEIVEYAQERMTELHGTIRDIVQWRLNLRTVMAALRRRQRGFDVPDKNEKWGFSYLVDHIVRHWNEPDFGLSRQYPWIQQARDLLAKPDFLSLERLILTVVWDYLTKASQNHYFDFEAVVLYVLRWNILERWIGYDSGEALKRFDELVYEGLKSAKDILAIVSYS